MEEHRTLFQNYLSNLKRNCSTISREDLNTVKAHLKAKEKGQQVEVPNNLKLRIVKHNFVLASFPNAPDAVCVLKDRNKQKV